MGVTASQIRQDLNHFGGFGQQGYGYNAAHLYEEIGKILGLDRERRMVIAGVGNFGQALAKYFAEPKKGFVLAGLFDSDPAREGQIVAGMPVRRIGDLADFVRENDIVIGILTVPKEAAQPVATLMAESGIRAIWNYAHVDLVLPEGVAHENVHLLDSLMTLGYDLARSEKKADM